MSVAAFLNPSLTRRSFCRGAGALAAVAAGAPKARAAGAPIRVVASNDYVPYSAVGADGKMHGLLVECLNLVAAKAGYAFEFHGAPWARAQQMVKTGEMDALCVYPTEERRSYLNFIDAPVITDRTGVVHRAADKRIQPQMTKEQLGALRIGTFLGAAWSQVLFPNNKLTMTGSQDAVVKMIGFDRLDAYVESEIMARTKIRGVSAPNAIAFTPIAALPAADFCFGLRRDFPGNAAVVADIGRAVTALHDNGALAKVRAQFAAPT
jgi:polar amino acid transport system substrate-binding protein